MGKRVEKDMSDLQTRTHTPQKPKVVGNKSMSSFMGIFRMRDTLSWRGIGSTDPQAARFAGTKLEQSTDRQASRIDGGYESFGIFSGWYERNKIE